MKNPYTQPRDPKIELSISKIAEMANQSIEVTEAVMIASFEHFLHEIDQSIGSK